MFRLLALLTVISLQIAAPLLHAHDMGYQDLTGLHLPGFESLAVDSANAISDSNDTLIQPVFDLDEGAEVEGKPLIPLLFLFFFWCYLALPKVIKTWLLIRFPPPLSILLYPPTAPRAPPVPSQ